MLRDLNKAYPSLQLFTVLIALMIFFWGLGSIDLMSLNEGRRALAIKEMVSSGDWLLPHLNGALYLTKPPLLYWLSSTFALIGGVNEWTLRLPSALAALAVLWMIYRYTLKQSNHLTALLAAQLLLANIGFVMLGRRAEIEMLLTAFCVGAVLSAIQYIQHQSNKNWIYLSYFLLALAMMTKGPVILLFITLPLIVALIFTKKPAIKTVILSWRGWLIFLIVGLAWYAFVICQLGFDVWANVAKHDMLEKMQSNSAKPILSYVGWIAVDFLLLVGLFAVKTKAMYRDFFKLPQQPERFVLLMAVLVPLMIFSLFSNKHAKYLLPIYPFIAILLATKIIAITDKAKDSVKKIVVIAGALLPVGFAVFYMMLEPKLFAYRVAVFPAFSQWVANNNQTSLYAYKDIDSRLVYYANKPIKLMNENSLQQAKNTNASFYLLAENDEISAVKPLADCTLKEFKPYLKKHHTLTVYGFGAVCSHDQSLNGEN